MALPPSRRPRLSNDPVWTPLGEWTDRSVKKPGEPEYAKIDEDGVPVAPKWIIIPEGTWKEKWDMMVLFFILYSVAIVPFRLCFTVYASGTMLVFEAAMSLFFMADVILTFRTAYAHDEGWVITPKLIAKRYLAGWFWIDAPSSVPMEIISIVLEHYEAGDPAAAGILQEMRLMRVLRVLRLLKLIKLTDYMEKLEEILEVALSSLYSGVPVHCLVQLAVMLLKVGFLSHILACFFYGIANNFGGIFFGHEDKNYARDEAQGGWFVAYAESLGVDDPSVGQLYLWSFYWAVMTLTTTGYGDITPTNDAEIAYVLVALVVGALVFGYMISNLSAIVNSLDRQAANVEEKMDAVKQYSQWRDLPHPLAVRLKRHYKYYYKRTAPFDEFELLNECPPALRHDVTRAVLQETLGKVPIFKDRLMVDPEFQNDIFPVAKPVHFHAGEIIFHRGERSRELFFMLRGEIDVYNETTHTVERKLTPTQEIFMTDSIYRAAHDPSLETRRRVSKAIITRLDVLKPKSESYFLPARASKDGQKDGQKSDSPSIEPLAILHTGCFGESVLTGRRRPNKLVAYTNVEALVVSKDDLLRVFEQNPRAARRVFSAVIKETERKERLHALSLTFMLAAAERGSELWGALRFQLGWARFQRSSRAFDLFGPMDSGGGLDLSTRFQAHDPLTHTEADLRSMSTSDHSPDDPMSFISTGKNANGQTHISLRTAGHVVDSLFDVHNKVRHAEEESVEQLREDRDAARRERDELRQELQMLREHLSKVI